MESAGASWHWGEGVLAGRLLPEAPPGHTQSWDLQCVVRVVEIHCLTSSTKVHKQNTQKSTAATENVGALNNTKIRNFYS
jgi:hypothetical protein